MAIENQGAVVRGIERIFNEGSLTGLSAGQLLRRFAAGDEVAFEALVTRHGPMVLGVCRRMLRDRRDVEDAFQATFLVLLRKGDALRDGERVGPWLHGVAYRVASRLRSRVARRPLEERKGARDEAVESDYASEVERNELRGVLDEEIGRLPETYRRLVVLCYLEGRTHEEAARRLRCSAGSVRGRLDRAREKLRDRLTRRGLAPAAGLTALAAGGEAASAGVVVPASLLAETVATLARAATASAVWATGSTAALELAEGVFRSMFLAKLKLAAILVVGILALGALPLVVALEPRGPAKAARDDPARAGGASAPARVQGITVTGRVLDEAGQPIAGARVARGSDLRGQEAVGEVTTDAAGRFAMQGVSPGGLVLTVQAPGHAPDLMSLRAGAGMAPVEFRLGRGHTILGRIVDAHSKPIAGAPISADGWRGHHSLRWNTRTDAEGRFRWDDAPADTVLIDLGMLGFNAKRFWKATADAPENTIPMRRPLHVRGRVTDADTGRPITAFTLVPGYTWQKIQNVWWLNDAAKELTGLSYDVLLSTEAGLGVIRIEAEGYLPETSRGLKDDEEDAVVHFALHRGSGITGVVRLPDGSPLAEADVLLSTPARPLVLNNGRPQVGMSDQRTVKSRADGRFNLAPSEPPYTIVVVHDRGRAVLTVRDKPAGEHELAIEPWGRVEGVLRFGRQLAAGEKLSLAVQRRPDPVDPLYWDSDTTSDGQGRFTFERVVPGEVGISRQIEWTDRNILSAGGSPSATVQVAAGATVRLELGGTGRAVVGKVVLPAELAGREDWLYGFCYFVRKPASTESGGAGGQASSVGRRDASFTFKVEEDGSFRIEDVEAGTYELLINANEEPPDHRGLGTVAVAMTRSEVVVPAMPGGRSDLPLDLGAVMLTAAKKREEPGARQP